MAATGSQEPGTPSGSSTWTVEAQALRPSCAAFPGTLAESRIGSRATKTSTAAPGWGTSHGGSLATPASNTGCSGSKGADFLRHQYMWEFILDDSVKTKKINTLGFCVLFRAGCTEQSPCLCPCVEAAAHDTQRMAMAWAGQLYV